MSVTFVRQNQVADWPYFLCFSVQKSDRRSSFRLVVLEVHFLGVQKRDRFRELVAAQRLAALEAGVTSRDSHRLWLDKNTRREPCDG